MFATNRNEATGTFSRLGEFRFIPKRVKIIMDLKPSKIYHVFIFLMLMGISRPTLFSKSISSYSSESKSSVFCWIACNNQTLGGEQKAACWLNPMTKQEPKKIVETVMIQSDASPRELGKLLIEFKKAGVKIENRINRKRRYNWIKDISFHFQHPQGLNFKVKVTGFQKLSFQFIYDEQNEFKYFTFRINEEKVYSLVELDIKGFKSYVCYDTGLVVRGETNEDIIRVY